MEYLVDGKKYHFNYSDLYEDYWTYRNMMDDEFLKPENLLGALHFACVVSYLKEIGLEATVSDQGVIHELVHLLTNQSTRELREFREQFNTVLCLAL